MLGFNDASDRVVSVGETLPFADEAFDASTKSGNYLARMQLMTANSEKCKGGDFPINHYALVTGSNMVDIGKDVDVLVISWRPKAIALRAVFDAP